MKSPAIKLFFTRAKHQPGYPYEVARRVSLYPVCRVAPAKVPSDELLRDYTRRCWRLVDRLTELCVPPLYGGDLRRVAEIRQTMTSCRPAFATYVEKTKTCNRRTLCPSCWARHAAGNWGRFDRQLFPVDRGSNSLDDLAMICRHVRYIVPHSRLKAFFAARFKAPGKARRPRNEMPCRRSEIVRFRRLGIVAGLEATRISVPDEDGKWSGDPNIPVGVAFRQFLFCARRDLGRVIGNSHLQSSGRCVEILDDEEVCYGEGAAKIVRTPVEAPSRRQVMAAASEVLAYPASIMTGDKTATAAYLEARRPYKLVTAFGKARPYVKVAKADKAGEEDQAPSA
jgi:hypothetical protein